MGVWGRGLRERMERYPMGRSGKNGGKTAAGMDERRHCIGDQTFPWINLPPGDCDGRNTTKP